MGIGVYVYGIASVAAGIVDLVWVSLSPPINPFRLGQPPSRSSHTSPPSGLIAGGAAIPRPRRSRAYITC